MTEPTKDWGKFKEEQEDKIAEEALLDAAEDSEESGDAGEGDGAPSLEHPTYAALEEKLTEAEQKAHENWDKLMRVNAEMDNLRRRSERDIAKAHKYGTEKIVQNMLPVMDSLEQAVQLAEQHGDKAMHEGLSLTMKLFLDMLAKSDVEQLNPEGETFDPELHEAMSMQENKEVSPNTVLTVFQKGYKLNGRVIRAAKVVVSK